MFKDLQQMEMIFFSKAFADLFAIVTPKLIIMEILYSSNYSKSIGIDIYSKNDLLITCYGIGLI